MTAQEVINTDLLDKKYGEEEAKVILSHCNMLKLEKLNLDALVPFPYLFIFNFKLIDLYIFLGAAWRI